MQRLAPILLALPWLVVGCATTRTVTLSARPADAVFKVEGVERGRGPITETFTFTSPTDVKRVQASRLGYKDQTVTLTRDFDRSTLLIDLKPQTKRITVNVTPVDGLVYLNDRPLAPDPVNSTAAEVEFAVDPRNNWIPQTLRAERVGFVAAETQVNFADRETSYTLQLAPMRKNVAIATNPPGAEVFIDGEPVGTSPLVLNDRPFPFDVDANQFVPQQLKAVKAGFDPVETTLSWDDGRRDYVVDLAAKSKQVRIVTDPPGGVVTVDGRELPRDASGASVARLIFPPINDQGELQTYLATIAKRTATREWYPANLTIGWDGGQAEYAVPLKEILTMPVPLLRPQLVRTDEGWQVRPERTSTIAAKDVSESSSVAPPVQVTQLPPGMQVDTLAVSPDGRRLLFTTLAAPENGNGDAGGGAPGDLRSQLAVMPADGGGGIEYLSDGKSLDLMPAFSPGGDAIVFSSNRAGRRLSVWTMSAVGAPGITNLTSGESHDLWPNLDSEPRPRLFYQSMIDTRADPRLFATQLGTASRTDLTPAGGMQPRINPKGDAILFSAVDAKTGKRDLYRTTDRGGAAENLTNTPDVDEFDGAWNKDGSRIAFVSDRAADADGRAQLDVWVMDLSRPDEPTRVTANASHDDAPAWDPGGEAIYFRSNRGGSWNVWKIAAP